MRRSIKVRRPPQPTIASARYARWARALLESWRSYVLAHPEASRGDLERTWAHLTDRSQWGRLFDVLGQTIETTTRQYWTRLFKRAQPAPASPAHVARGTWVDTQFDLLADVGADQIDRLLAARAEHTDRTDARGRPPDSDPIAAIRRENIALIGGTNPAQREALGTLFSEAQAVGARHETLITEIQSTLEIGKNRARLIARDQTVKYNAVVNRAQAEASGVREYTWRTSHDGSVRLMHKLLDGRVFSFDNPPITNKDGDRNNPGGDYQCRCQAEPKLNQTQNLFAGLSEPDFGPGLGFGGTPEPAVSAPRVAVKPTVQVPEPILAQPPAPIPVDRFEQAPKKTASVFGTALTEPEIQNLIAVDPRLVGGKHKLEWSYSSTTPGALSSAELRERGPEHTFKLSYQVPNSDPDDYDTRIIRKYIKTKDRLTVEHEYFTLPGKLQGQGIGDTVIANEVAEYIKLGVDEIHTTAAWEGRFIWPDRGFVLRNPEDWTKIRAGWADWSSINKGLAEVVDDGRFANLAEMAADPEGRAYLTSVHAPGTIELTAKPADVRARLEVKKNARTAAKK